MIIKLREICKNRFKKESERYYIISYENIVHEGICTALFIVSNNEVKILICKNVDK